MSYALNTKFPFYVYFCETNSFTRCTAHTHTNAAIYSHELSACDAATRSAIHLVNCCIFIWNLDFSVSSVDKDSYLDVREQPLGTHIDAKSSTKDQRKIMRMVCGYGHSLSIYLSLSLCVALCFFVHFQFQIEPFSIFGIFYFASRGIRGIVLDLANLPGTTKQQLAAKK